MKILKIKVGEVFIDKKAYPVFMTAFQKESRDKKTKYYEARMPIFVQEVQDKPKVEKVEVEV